MNEKSERKRETENERRREREREIEMQKFSDLNQHLLKKRKS